MSPTIARIVPDESSIAAWLCLCPLLAVASSWPVALTLAICLLLTIALTASTLAALGPFVSQALQLPLSALLAGTFAVLEHLALAAWWPDLEATAAPWLVLVAGLAVLVCSGSGEDDEFDFIGRMKLGPALSAALLVVGVARDGFGRVFLLAETPVGALVLLALLLAGLNFVARDSGSSSQPARLSPLGPGLRRDDGPQRNTSATGFPRNDELPRSATDLPRDDEQSRSAAGLRRDDAQK